VKKSMYHLFLNLFGLSAFLRVFRLGVVGDEPGGSDEPPVGSITQEVRDALANVREAVGQNADLSSRVDQIEAAATARNADVTAIRQELDQVRQQAEQREATITEMQRRQREQGLERDGFRNRNHALEIFGMGCRQALANHLRTELPSQFRGEADTLRNYREHRATLSADASPGTLMIPTMLEMEIFDGLEEVSDVLNRVNFLPGLPGNIDVTVATSRPDLQFKRATIDTDMTQGDPGFAQMSLRPDEAYLFTPVDNRLLLMNPHDLGRMLLPMLRDSTIEGIVKALIVGDGSSSYNDILGILAETTAAYIQRTSGTAFTATTYQDLAKIKTKALKRARRRGAWLMHEEVLWSLVGELNRDGKAKVLQYDSQGNPLVMGAPVVFEEEMPTMDDTAANTGLLGFGDLRAYTVGLQGGIQLDVSEHLFFRKNQTCFRALVNMDIKRAPAKLFILGKTATT